MASCDSHPSGASCRLEQAENYAQRRLCWWMSKQEKDIGCGAEAQLHFIITQSVFSQEKWVTRRAQVHSVCFAVSRTSMRNSTEGVLRGAFPSKQLQLAPHPGQTCALNAKLPHKLEMTTWFMQVIHFTVRLADIAVIQYSNLVLHWGKWGRCSEKTLELC